MKKRTLLVSSTDVMCYLFLRYHILYLSNLYEIHVVCARPKGFLVNEYFKKLRDFFPDHIELSEISSQRSPLSLVSNAKGLIELITTLRKTNFDIVWTNEPVVGAITRLAVLFSKRNPTVVYMAHGLHFFSGSPILNWVIYYPIEKILSFITDVFILINEEDFARVKNRFKKNAYKIPGIGFDVEFFYENRDINASNDLRLNMNIHQESIVLVSVGELMIHKNHAVIIKALAKLEDKNLHYIIVGKGELENELKKMVKFYQLEGNVHFLGYREDVKSILGQCDIFCHPSKREGLGVASLEAMAVGLPILTSNVHGLKDYSINGLSGFNCSPNDVDCFMDKIQILRDNADLRKNIGKDNRFRVKKFDTELVSVRLAEILNSL